MVARRPVLPAALVAAALLLCSSSVSAGTIRGQVIDPDGRPVPGATVVIASPLSGLRTVMTDATGRFSVERVDPGRYDVRIVLTGFRADPVSVTLAEHDDVDVPVPLHLAALAESVVVTASQVEVPLTRTTDSVSVLSSADLDVRQIDSVGDALRLVPGMTVAANGGRGSVTSVLPRGSDSDYTLVLVDGIKVNAFGGGSDFSQLALAGVDRIEVVRGPQSALYGSDAIGAVVQIVTRHGGPTSATGLAEGGSFGTSHLSAATSGSHRGWSWGAAAERFASAGFEGIAPATGERVTNDDWLSTHASAALGWRAAGGLDLGATAAFTTTDRGYPGPFGSNPIGAYTGVDRVSRGKTTTGQLGLRLATPWPGLHGVRQSVQFTYLDLASDFTSTYGFSSSGTQRLTARAQTDVAVGGSGGLSVGVELQREQASSTFITGSAYEPVPIRRFVAGSFAEARYQPNERLSLSAGLRVEYIRRDRLESNADFYSPRPAFESDATVALNPKVSGSYLLRQPRTWAHGEPWSAFFSSTRLHASAGTGIRPPDAFEIAFTDNPALKPERSRSAEIGLEQAFAGEAIHVDVTSFYNRFSDLIVAVGPAMGDISRYRTDNISNASSAGLEASALLRTRWGLEARVAYTFLSTRILAVDGGRAAPVPFVVGQPLLRRPSHQGSIDVAYARGRLSAFCQIGGRSRVLDVEPTYGTYGGLFTNPAYMTSNAGMSVRVTGPVELIVKVVNLTDRRYEETFGFPAPGRSVLAGIRVAAGK
jgi:outer membrane cobalamin receptor